MASNTEVMPQSEEVPETEVLETPDRPVLDLLGAAIKALIRSARARGYVTHDEVNSVLRSEEVNSEQIEDVLAKLSEMGGNVIDAEEPKGHGEEQREDADEDAEGQDGELVEIVQKVPAKSDSKEPSDRTNDPVRMYLRDMGSVELLTREGEIAIAKRIEAGREAMIAALCESPLTFQAIIIWRDELNQGTVLLRDIIDLDATYAGPDGQVPAPAADAATTPGAPAQTSAPPTAPPRPAQPTRAPEPAAGEDGEGDEKAPGDDD